MRSGRPASHPRPAPPPRTQAASAVISVTHPFHFDLTAEEAQGRGVPVVRPDVLVSHTWGNFSQDQYLDTLTTIERACVQVAEFSRLYLKT